MRIYEKYIPKPKMFAKGFAIDNRFFIVEEIVDVCHNRRKKEKFALEKKKPRKTCSLDDFLDTVYSHLCQAGGMVYLHEIRKKCWFDPKDTGKR